MSDEAKKRILARRAKFIAAAIVASGVNACSSVADSPGPAADTGVKDTSSAVTDTGTPEPCLGATPPDSSVTDSTLDTGATDTAPMPCLDPAPDDADVDAGPAPCLKMPPPDAG